jgi:hypothetical protein
VSGSLAVCEDSFVFRKFPKIILKKEKRSASRTKRPGSAWTVMSTSQARRFPVTVTQLPVTHCQICHQTVAYRPGSLSEVLTEHYRRAHPQALGMPSR